MPRCPHSLLAAPATGLLLLLAASRDRGAGRRHPSTSLPEGLVAATTA